MGTMEDREIGGCLSACGLGGSSGNGIWPLRGAGRQKSRCGCFGGGARP